MDVLVCDAGDAALWIAARFEVPTITAGKRLPEVDRVRGRVGYERGLELLVRSGIFGLLSAATQSIATVFQSMAEREDPTSQEFRIPISYRGITRYSGVRSPNAIRKALLELGEIGFLRFPEVGLGRSSERPASLSVLTPNSNEVIEFAHATASQLEDRDRRGEGIEGSAPKRENARLAGENEISNFELTERAARAWLY